MTVTEVESRMQHLPGSCVVGEKPCASEERGKVRVERTKFYSLFLPSNLKSLEMISFCFNSLPQRYRHCSSIVKSF